MTNEQLVALIRAGENVKENMLQLWQKNKGFIYKIAVRFSGYAELEDLLQESYIGLHEAVFHYDESRDTKFLTCATFWIRQELQRYVENKGGVVRIPSGVQGEIRRYKKIHSEYLKYYGHEPTDLEMRGYLGMGAEKLDQIKTVAKWGKIASLSAPIGEDEDCSLSDVVASDQDMEEDVIKRLDHELMSKSLNEAIDSLPEQQADIMRKRYFERMTLEEVGKSIGFSGGYVRQEEAKAFRRLRTPSRCKVYKSYTEQYISASPIYSVGVGKFQSTWTSATEELALRRCGDTSTSIAYH